MTIARSTPTAARPARTNGRAGDATHLREHEVALFDLVAGLHYNGNESLWDAALDQLNLPLCYQSAVQRALADGRWRGAASPRAYVATTAYRIALKENLLPMGDLDDRRGRSRIECGPVSSFIPLSYGGPGAEWTHQDSVDRFFWPEITETEDDDEPPGSRIPDWLRSKQRRGHLVDWWKVARYAVRKESMVDRVGDVLQFKAIGIGREIAVRVANDQKERAAIAAAWKWVDRNWESRIVPLFHLDEPPAPVMKAKPPAGKPRGKMVPPWEALRQVCDRANRVSAGLAR
jgi:hypothetical protein